MARGRQSSLWPKATTLETLKTGQNGQAVTKQLSIIYDIYYKYIVIKLTAQCTRY